MLGRKLRLDLHQDNQATARMMLTGRAPALSNIRRTHGVSIAWVNERAVSDDVELHDCMSTVMAADNFTMHFVKNYKSAG